MLQPTSLLMQAMGKLTDEGKQTVLKHVCETADKYSEALNKGATPVELTAHIMLEMDERLEKYVPASKVTCKKGCAYCCHINVDMTIAEAELIVEYCREKKIYIDTRILENQKHMTNKARAISKVSGCVFLSDKNLCRIHKVRPLNCRKHLSGDKPKWCDAANKESHRVAYIFEVNSEVMVTAVNSIGLEAGSMGEMILKVLNKNLSDLK